MQGSRGVEEIKHNSEKVNYRELINGKYN